MSRETLKVAVVGLGKMGLLHTCILNVLPNVKLTALCEKSVITRKFLKKMFHAVPIVDDVQKLSDLDLDMVYVTTPIPSHYPIARTIFSKKIARNLFVEKTLASSYDESKELCGLAQNFGGVNMVGYLRRFAVTFRKAKELLAQDAIGETFSFKAYAYSSDFFGIKKGAKAPTFRGGVLKDLGCHAVDLALWLFGDLQVEYAKLTSVIDTSCEDSVYFRVKKSDGLEGEFNISWCVDGYRIPEVGLSINGSKGIMEVDDDKLQLKMSEGKKFTWYRHNLQDNVAFWLGGPEYFRENEYFVKSVAENHNAEPSFHTASKVDQIIEQVKNRAEKSD